MYDPRHSGTVIVNVAWTVFNMTLLSVATAVAWENQQRRRAVRVNVEVPSGVILPDGSVMQGLTGDLSSTGVRLWTGARLNVRPGDAVRIVLPVLDGDASLPATVVRVEDESLRAQFDALSLAEDESLTMVLYSRADTWLGWDDSRERDHPVRSLVRIARLAMRGLRHSVMPARRRSTDGRLLTSIVPLVIAAVLLPAWARLTAQETSPTAAAAQSDAGKKPVVASAKSDGSGTQPVAAAKKTDAAIKQPSSPAKQPEVAAKQNAPPAKSKDSGASKPADSAAKQDSAEKHTDGSAKKKDAAKDPAAKPGDAAAKKDSAATKKDPLAKPQETTAKQADAAGAQKATAAKTSDSTNKQTADAAGVKQTKSGEPAAVSGKQNAAGGQAAADPGKGSTAQKPGDVSGAAHSAAGKAGAAAKDVPSAAGASSGTAAVAKADPATKNGQLAKPLVPAVLASTATSSSSADPAVQTRSAAQQTASSADPDATATGITGVAASNASATAQLEQLYDARVLPVWWRACGLAALYPWGLLILVVLQTFLIAVLLRAALRRRARERLLGHI
jgi:hypothetical protein